VHERFVDLVEADLREQRPRKATSHFADRHGGFRGLRHGPEPRHQNLHRRHSAQQLLRLQQRRQHRRDGAAEPQLRDQSEQVHSAEKRRKRD